MLQSNPIFVDLCSLQVQLSSFMAKNLRKLANEISLVGRKYNDSVIIATTFHMYPPPITNSFLNRFSLKMSSK